MGTSQIRGAQIENISDNEGEEAQGLKEEVEDATETRFLRAMVKIGNKPKPNTRYYSGILNAKELMDWTTTMEKYYDYKSMEEFKEVKLDSTRLKSHASIW